MVVNTVLFRFFIALVFLLTLPLTVRSAPATIDPDTALGQKNILLLHSYHKGLIWTDEQNEGMIQTFHDQGLEPIFHVEYMDWKYSPTAENLQQRYEQYKLRYASRKIDLILTTDDAALAFAMKHRRELFSNAPVVFTGVLRDSAQALTQGQPNVTGVYEKFDTAGTLQLIRRFDPALQRLYLLYDNSESGLQAAQIMVDDARRADPGLEFIHLNKSSFAGILYLLANPPNLHSAVLINTYSRDVDGMTMEMERFVRRFSEVSKIPLYILYDFDSNHGAVGGSLTVSRQQGAAAALVGTRLLQGESSDVIPPLDSAGFNTILDYSQMVRYKLPLAEIPADAKIINRPITFYEKYRLTIWVTGSVFAAMSIIVALLLINLRHRTQTARKLAAARTYLDKIINSVADPIFVKNTEHRWVLANQAMADFLGHSRERIVGKMADELLLPGEGEIHYQRDLDVFNDGQEKTYIAEITNAAGAVRSLEIKKTRYTDPLGKHYLVGVVRDITNIKRAEEMLRRANEDLETKVLQRTQQLADANCELTALNQNMLAVNESLQEANRNLETEINERRRIEEQLQQTIFTLQQTQDQLIRSGKLAALGSLVAGVAHEINTPLGNSVTAASCLRISLDTITSQLSELAGEHPDLTDCLNDQRDGLELLETNLQRAVELVRSFKNVATEQLNEEKHPFNVRQTLADTLLTLRSRLKKTPLQVTVHCAENLVWNSFPGILSQIVANLVANSVAHAYLPQQAGQLTLEMFTDDGEMVLNYTDDGCGMNSEVRDKLFDPFFTTNRGGGSTGLGMYIVYNLVTQKLGGSIHCYSAPGAGTRFLIRVPLQ